MKLLHRGDRIVMVKAPQPGSCNYCIYAAESSDWCPKNRERESYCFVANRDDEPDGMKDEGVWIEDTPEALAAYVAYLLDPTEEDDDDI